MEKCQPNSKNMVVRPKIPVGAHSRVYAKKGKNSIIAAYASINEMPSSAYPIAGPTGANRKNRTNIFRMSGVIAIEALLAIDSILEMLNPYTSIYNFPNVDIRKCAGISTCI